jgi:hypothetical protein
VFWGVGEINLLKKGGYVKRKNGRKSIEEEQIESK